MGWATNWEIDGSRGGATEGLKPSVVSAIIAGCDPDTPPLGGTAGWAPGDETGIAATGTVGAAEGGAGLLAGGGVALSGGGAVVSGLLACGADVCGGDTLATARPWSALGGAAAASVPPLSASELYLERAASAASESAASR